MNNSHSEWSFYIRRAQQNLNENRKTSARSFIAKGYDALIELLANRRITRASYRRAMLLINNLYEGAKA
jgi:hypothetical protein